MTLKKRSKVDASFSMSSMTDIVFLLLVFFMVTSTLISPNALKLVLPESNNQTASKPVVTLSITNDLKYYINADSGEPHAISFSQIEPQLQTLISDPEAIISLHADKTVAIEEVVKIMNIARRNDYKLILATSASN
ncbi:MAG: ExbD/TolR family protein [Mangrovibacterium sp.]